MGAGVGGANFCIVFDCGSEHVLGGSVCEIVSISALIWLVWV